MDMSLKPCSPMRILIADPQPASCMLIEKLLGLQGYFRVCPANSFEELTALTHYHPALHERFDLLIVNAKLLTDANIDPAKFCVNNSRLRNVLVYGAPELAMLNAGELCSKPQQRVQVLTAFNCEQVIDFLNTIDPGAVVGWAYGNGPARQIHTSNLGDMTLH
ncbi:hypothetical protein ACIQSO_01140 [Pseudomonas putida]|uniref:hypothetical protein n=1 Tax=Pseudomonas putida TaxID=303 RepID=UPI00383A97B1